MRRRLDEALDGDGFGRERVLACAVRLLDVGFFRIGGETYAARERQLRPRDGAQAARQRPGARRRRVRLPGKARAAARPARRRPGLRRDRRGAPAPPLRGRGAARLQARQALARRALAGHQRLHQGGHGPRRVRQGLPHLERDGAGGRVAGRGRRAAVAPRDRAGDPLGRRAGRLPPRQHAGGRARLATSIRASSTSSATAARSSARWRCSGRTTARRSSDGSSAPCCGCSTRASAAAPRSARAAPNRAHSGRKPHGLGDAYSAHCAGRIRRSPKRAPASPAPGSPIR